MGTTVSPKDTKFKEHPVQLADLSVRELSIVANRPPDVSTTAEPSACSIRVANAPYNSKHKVLVVSLRLELGVDAAEDETPYSMKIELIGVFEVDEAKFPVDRIPDWAKRGAPLVMYPYLREQAFSLSSKCGFKPLILPLLEVSTFKIEEPKPKPKPKSKTQKSAPKQT